MSFQDNPFLLDRSWMERRIPSHGSGLSTEFIKGVVAFINCAFANPNNVSGGRKMRCPCLKCDLRMFEEEDVVHLHLLKYGFTYGYRTWTSHGEVEVVSTFPMAPCATTLREDSNPFANMVRDAVGPSFDWDARANDARDNEAPNKEAKEFYELLENAEQPLYDGCKRSKLAAVVEFLVLKSNSGMAEKYYDQWMKKNKKLATKRCRFG